MFYLCTNSSRLFILRPYFRIRFGETYEAADEVQARGNICKFKPLPFSTGCDNPYYMPSVENSASAWTDLDRANDL